MLAPREKLWPAPVPVVDHALRMLEVTPEDTLADYGCGNGVALFAAARLGARAVGYEIHEPRAKEVQEQVDALGIGDRVTVKACNALDADPKEPSCVYLYLIARGLGAILPLLRRIAGERPGRTVRVATVLYRIPGVQHVRMEKVYTSDVSMSQVYLYHIGATPEEDGAGGFTGNGRGAASGAGSGGGTGAENVEAGGDGGGEEAAGQLDAGAHGGGEGKGPDIAGAGGVP
jgi:precorrin-6B methylase 2